MAGTFQLEVVTPDRQVVHDTAEEVQIPAKKGYMGVLPGHAPLITELAVGEITYRKGAEEHHLAVAWGFAEVLPEKVTILAETAERAQDIDPARAEEALRRAQERLRSADSQTDFQRALVALERAQVRLRVAQKKATPAS
jgi:F-type H+-transporting ATPase subunit epsilon